MGKLLIMRRTSLRRKRNGGGVFIALLLALPLGSFMAVFFWDGVPLGLAAAFATAMPQPTARDPEAMHFGVCYGRHGDNCIIDGDSLIYKGRQIRIADIDTPELGDPKCAAEYALGMRAKEELRDLLNAGPFSLNIGDRDHDRYGRDLRVLTRDGQSLGDTLVASGLAHRWTGRRLPWCH